MRADQALSQVNGVGTLTALSYVLTLADKDRFLHSQDGGSDPRSPIQTNPIWRAQSANWALRKLATATCEGSVALGNRTLQQRYAILVPFKVMIRLRSEHRQLDLGVSRLGSIASQHLSLACSRPEPGSDRHNRSAL
jgi:hypothetical protein